MTPRLTKSSAALLRTALRGSTMLSLALGAHAQAQEALPSGGAVAAGDAAIGVSGTGLRIDQTSSRAVINWSGFSVGADKTVQFNQPDAQAATLNRVLGTTPSTIAGQISANGAVYLVNPNGIAITQSGSVDVGGGFVATTLDIADSDFMAGKASFTGKGASGKVSNAGRITAGQGGYVALLGGSVANSGTITVPLGKLALGSGEQIALDINGGNFLQVAVPSSVVTGSAALIDNSGTITVAGGSVSLKAAVVKDAVRNVINMSGSISADSAVGNGGTIHLIGGADTASMAGQVTVSGSLSARATGASGDGGFIETSGAKVDLNGVQVSTTAANGKSGTWLIDPVDFVIAASGGDITGAALSANLGGGNVTILSSSGAGGSNGDVLVNDAVSWTSNSHLTLTAARNIAITAGITGRSGGLMLNAAASTGQITATAPVDVGLFQLGSGNWVQNSASLPGFAVHDFRLTGGTFLRAAGGDGSSGSPFLLSDIYGLQGISGFLSADFALSANIDASGTANWNSGAGFVPIASASAYFSGSLDGTGHSINGIFIDNSLADDVGLFSYIASSGRVSNLALAGGEVTARIKTISNDTDILGARVAGAIAARNFGTIVNSSSSAAVGTFGTRESYRGTYRAGDAIAGGLVGINYGTISQSFSTGPVLAIGLDGGSYVCCDYIYGVSGTTDILIGFSGGQAYAGGIAGRNLGILREVFSIGNVKAQGGGSGLSQFDQLPHANAYAGGIAGYNGNSLSLAYATGSIVGLSGVGGDEVIPAGATYTGGIVGRNDGTIAQTYATGAINPSLQSGGVVGDNAGTVSSSFWDTQTTGIAAGSGSGTGLSTAQLQTLSTFTDAGWDIGAQGGISNAWRIYEGNTYPLLKAFLRRADYTAPATSYQYDGTAKSLSGWSFAPGVDMAKILGTASTGVTATNAGTYYPTGLYSSQLGYDIVATPLTITPAPVTVFYRANAVNRAYGDANPALSGTYSVSGLIGSDTLSGTVSWLTAALTTSNVGSYAVNGSGLNAGSNYAITHVQAADNAIALTITPRPLSIYYRADAATRIFGLANPALGGSVSYEGLIDPSHISGTAAWTTTATPVSNVGSYAITGSGLSATSNYAVQAFQSRSGPNAYDNSAALTITRAPLTITFIVGARSMSYGDVVPTSFSGTAIYNFAPGSAFSPPSGASLVTAATQSSPVGQYAINGTVNAADYANYDLTLIQAPGNATALTINPRPITITADALSRYYGDANPALTYKVGGSGLVNGDTLSGALATTATVTSNVGDYAITQGTLAASANYTVTSFTGANLSVAPRPLTVTYTADAASRLFGDFNPAFTGTTAIGGMGLVNGDTLGGTAAWSSPAVRQSNIGSYAITGSGLTASSNYALTSVQAPGNATALTITPYPVTVYYQALPTSMTYGDEVPVFRGSYSYSSFGFDPPSVNPVFTTTATSQSGVGKYAIVGSGITFSSNYLVTVIQINTNARALTINPRAITVTADALSRYYGDANPALTYQVGGKGLVNGDTLSGALATTATVTSNVGDYAITQGTLAASSNYALTYTGANLSVTPRPITVTYTANPVSRTYGDANPALSGTTAVGGLGLVDGDTLAGTAAWTTPATAASNAGSYAIEGSGLTASGNYALTSVQAKDNATALTVVPRAVTVTYTANPVTRSYGDQNPLLAGSYTVQGLVNGDSVFGVVAWRTGANALSAVGSYGITGTGLTASRNYALTSVQAAGNATALTITPRVITINAYAKVRNYGDANPALNYWIGGQGLANGNTLSGVLATSATTTSSVGAYAITQGTLAASANYSVTYNGANLTILPRPLTVTYTAAPASRTYGDANPTLTGSVSSAGLVGGDTLTGAATWTTSATATSGVGSYRVTGSGLSASSNYRLSVVQAAGNATALTINPRAITITADALTRYYGSTNPALTFTVGGQGLVNGDNLVGSLATSATVSSAPGDYAITRGSLWASPNYTVTYTGANLTIIPR